MRKTLVIPTNRLDRLHRFFGEWGCQFAYAGEGQGGWDDVVVVYDGHLKDDDRLIGPNITMLDWSDIDKLGERGTCFSRRDSAIRSFGFYEAWMGHADYILTLDDDCYPSKAGYPAGTLFDQHLECMRHSAWIPSVPDQPTRGYPYDNVGTFYSKINMGLWENVPDWDSVQALRRDPLELKLEKGSRIAPRHQYFPFCGMNVCFERDATPLMYFPLMGDGVPFRRFDDIWAGIIAKRVCDQLDWAMSFGEPFIWHDRASDKFVNLVKEAPGIAANEGFWKVIEGTYLQNGRPLELLGQLAGRLTIEDKWQAEYSRKLGAAMHHWVDLFKEAGYA